MTLGLFAQLQHEQRSRVYPGASVATADGWLASLIGGADTLAGIAVDERAALTYAPFFAGVAAISESIGSLPLKLYRRTKKGREEAVDDPRFQIVHASPNEEMTAMVWRATMLVHALVWGNHYSEIRMDGGGRVGSLDPLMPDRVTPDRTQDGSEKLFYRVTHARGPETILEPRRVLHVPGPSLNAVLGINQVGLHREAIGAGIATTLFASAFFGNGSLFGGFLEHPGKLSDPARINLEGSLKDKHSGVRKAGKLRILEEGMKYSAAGTAPVDAQMTETRKLQVTEAARMNRVPPHKIGDLERATFSNIEHQAIEFVTGTLLPWLVRIEQELNRKLLTREEQRTMYFRHNVDGLLRGDMHSRFQSYAIGRQWGWLSANDVLEREDLNPLPGDQGDKYMVPLNMVDAAGEKREQETASDDDPADPRALLQERTEKLRRRIGQAFVPLLHRELERVAKRQAGAAARLLEKLPGGGDYLVELFRELEQQRKHTAQVLGPVLRALMESVAGELADVTSEGGELARSLELTATARAEGLAQSHSRELRERLQQIVLAGADLQQLRDEIELWGNPSPQNAHREAEGAAAAAVDLVLEH